MLKSIIASATLVASVLAAKKPKIEKIDYEHFFDFEIFDDSSTIVAKSLGEETLELHISKNFGKDWEVLLSAPKFDLFSEIEYLAFTIDEQHPERGYATTLDDVQKVTFDKGENWEEVHLKHTPSTVPLFVVNDKNLDHYLVMYSVCSESDDEEEPEDHPDGWRSQSCRRYVYYSTDRLKTLKEFKSVPDGKRVSGGCIFQSSGGFKNGDDSTVLCTFDNALAFSETIDTIIFSTKNWGKSINIIELDREVIPTKLSSYEGFITLVGKEDAYDRRSKRYLYVSKDGLTFQKADTSFDGNSVREFEIIDHSEHSLIIATYGLTADGTPMYALVASEETGLYYRKIAASGNYFSDMQKIEAVPGSYISSMSINLVTDEVYTGITFDYGRTWQPLKLEDDGTDYGCDISDPKRCSLQIRTILTENSDTLLSGSTPGIIMGFGKVLGGSKVLGTFISRDGGLHWKRIFDFRVTWAFGDMGNVIVAFGETKIFYSTDQGVTWDFHDVGRDIGTGEIITTSDGSGLKFLVTATAPDYDSGDDGSPKMKLVNTVYLLDFGGVFENCKNRDLEIWQARGGECGMGKKLSYNRRKQDAKCFRNELYKDIQPIEEVCKCTSSDFECAVGFLANDDGECIPDSRYIGQHFCKTAKQKLKIASKRKIPGNVCKGGEDDVAEIEIDCPDIYDNSAITTHESNFAGSIDQYKYFSDGDESLLVRQGKHLFVSHDGGENFQQFDKPVSEIIMNEYFGDVAIVIANKHAYVTQDRGQSFKKINLPEFEAAMGELVTFSPTNNQTFIFMANSECTLDGCTINAHITEDGGSSWQPLIEDVSMCEFTGGHYEDKTSQIMCVKNEGSKSSIVVSDDKFENSKTIFEDAVGFAMTGKFVFVASADPNSESLRAHVTADGNNFAEIQFPKDFQIKQQQTYTILGANTGSVFLHVTTHAEKDGEFGAILKSNYNGTTYNLIQRHVNRNDFGYVDFEQVENLAGISVINVVSNSEDVSQRSKKKLVSKISFNDGAQYQPLAAPARDSNGKAYSCKGCSLHIHGYTDRKDFTDIMSSGSAVGLMIAMGNVGEYLLPLDECDTFITTDGGKTWREVSKGVHQYEYGDRGSILVLVEDETDTIKYSLDGAISWNDYKFANSPVHVHDIVTVPRDNAMRFMLITSTMDVGGVKSVTYTINFSDLFTRQCVYNSQDSSKSDYEYWTPFDCLFGEKTQYLRRTKSDCFIGAAPLNDAIRVTETCACTRADFECGYNYYNDIDGTCKLVPGLSPADNSQQCAKNSDLVQYFDPTGYRKIPLSKCVGGLALDQSTPHACPNKQREFDELHGIGGSSILAVILVPLLVFVGCSWFVYERGIKRNGGFARFGEIRLGDDGMIEENNTDRVVNNVVRGLVIFVATTGAFVQAMYKFTSGPWHALKSKILNRRRSGPSYSSVIHDQFLDEADDLLSNVDADANLIETDDDFNIDDTDESQREYRD